MLVYLSFARWGLAFLPSPAPSSAGLGGPAAEGPLAAAERAGFFSGRLPGCTMLQQKEVGPRRNLRRPKVLRRGGLPTPA